MIVLPSEPYANGATARVIDAGGYLQPPGGGEVQRINRLGNRYAVSFAMPPLENDRDGRIWVNRLLRGMQEGARMDYPLLDFDPGAPGRFVVDGGGQAGTSLKLRGGTPHYAFREGQPFNVVIGGDSYLDFIAEQAIADASGGVTITLTQMLRKMPADGGALNLARPVIEGFLIGDAMSWEISLARHIGLSFEIHEAR